MFFGEELLHCFLGETGQKRAATSFAAGSGVKIFDSRAPVLPPI